MFSQSSGYTWKLLKFPHFAYSWACDQASYQLLPALIIELIAESFLNLVYVSASPSVDLSSDQFAGQFRREWVIVERSDVWGAIDFKVMVSSSQGDGCYIVYFLRSGDQ